MGAKFRLIVAGIIGLIAVASYYGTSSDNPVTGEKQRVALTPEQEIALGLQSAPQMAAQFGGLSKNAEAMALVKETGAGWWRKSVAAKSPYQYDFHLLADGRTVNAFALPGGQIFITGGLMRLLRTPGELAAVLGHEVGHVIARHSAEHLAKQQLTQGLVGAVAVGSAATMTTAQIGAAGRRADQHQIRPRRRARIRHARDPPDGGGRLRSARHDRRDGSVGQGVRSSRQPEMLSTHPNPENRAARIKAEIAEKFPRRNSRGTGALIQSPVSLGVAGIRAPFRSLCVPHYALPCCDRAGMVEKPGEPADEGTVKLTNLKLTYGSFEFSHHAIAGAPVMIAIHQSAAQRHPIARR